MTGTFYYPKRKKLSKDDRRTIFEKTNGNCGYCGNPLDSRWWNVDHMKPISCGGGNEMENLIASCFPCNNLKHRDTVEQFRDRIGQQINRLLTYSVNYNTARRFNLLKVTDHAIVFYFEKIKSIRGEILR